MNDDDAAASPLFCYLRTQLPDLLERAVLEGWKVAVPKAASLRGAAISQALVESHLLRQTAIRDEWKTANGRTVTVVKDTSTGNVKLISGRGFPVQGNAVDVLAEDLWYGPNSDQGLQLVSISDTLEKDSSTLNSFAASALDSLPETFDKTQNGGGGKKYPQQTSEPLSSLSGGGKEFEELQWCMDDKECLKYIESIKGSGKPLLKLEKKLVEFSRTYVFARNYEKETAEKLKNYAVSFADETDEGYCDSAYKSALCHSLNILESKIWSSLKDLYSKEDMKTKSAMEEKIRTNCSGLGIPEELLDVDFSEAVKAVKALAGVKSPVMKLFCLQDIQEKTIDAICKGRKQAAVTVFGSMSNKASHVIGMDELLPLFIYVVCQSGIADLVTTFKMIKFFSYDIGTNIGNSAFLTSLCESCVNYLIPL